MPIGNGGIIGPTNDPDAGYASGVWGLTEQFLAIKEGDWPTGVGRVS